CRVAAPGNVAARPPARKQWPPCGQRRPARPGWLRARTAWANGSTSPSAGGASWPRYRAPMRRTSGRGHSDGIPATTPGLLPGTRPPAHGGRGPANRRTPSRRPGTSGTTAETPRVDPCTFSGRWSYLHLPGRSSELDTNLSRKKERGAGAPRKSNCRRFCEPSLNRSYRSLVIVLWRSRGQDPPGCPRVSFHAHRLREFLSVHVQHDAVGAGWNCLNAGAAPTKAAETARRITTPRLPWLGRAARLARLAGSAWLRLA